MRRDYTVRYNRFQAFAWKIVMTVVSVLYFTAGEFLTKFHGAVAAFIINVLKFELLVPAVGNAC